MVERCGRLRLAPKSGLVLVRYKRILGKKLERDDPAEIGVFCLVHDAHPAHTELVQDFVLGDVLSDHFVNSRFRCADQF